MIDLPQYEESNKTYKKIFSNEHEPRPMITTSRYENKISNDNNNNNYNLNEQERKLIKNMIDIFIYTYKLNYTNSKSISKLFKNNLLKKNFRTYFTNYIYTLFNYGKTYNFLTPYNKDNDRSK